MATISEKSLTAKPFLKWAGGKGQLIDEIDKRLPKALHTGNIDTYIEPFVGGGAVFFHIAQQFKKLKHIYLLDANQDLVNCYNNIKSDVESVIRELHELAHKYNAAEDQKKFYLDIRHKFNETKHNWAIANAAQLIFLNRTCFNGLYRVNRKGFFNVPFGDYKNPNICNAHNLRNVSLVLQKTNIMCADFEASIKYINNHTFVYFDPPYRPLSKTASFTSYSKDSFSEQDQIRLANFCKQIHKKGAKFLLSNSDPKNEDPKDHFFEDHYSEFIIERVKASRAINCKGNSRGAINEIIARNY